MAPKKLIHQIQAVGLSPFRTMTIMVSNGCNLNCRHCWLDCRPLKFSTPVATDKICGAIDAFAQLGGTHIILTGGEFFSHPHWRSLLQFCIEHDDLAVVGVQTNATLLNRDIVEFISGLPREKITLHVSLDGAQPDAHDFVRGIGTFNRAMSGINLLVAAGLARFIEVAFTEMAHNFEEIPTLLDMVDRMGIRKLVTSTLVKGGRAADSRQMQLPRPEQYQALIHLYQTQPRFKKLYHRKAQIAALEWFQSRSAQTGSDCDCLNNLFLDFQGHLYPCPMLRFKQYASESIYRAHFDQCIRQALKQWCTIPDLRQKRREVIGVCEHCAGRHHCGGGCMGRTAPHRIDLMMPEDRCNLRQAIYQWPYEL